jgi:hypothetical protein
MLTRLVDKDDTGDTTSGTIRDNGWLQQLNNTIDARWSVYLVNPGGGVINNFDVQQCDYLQLNTTSDVTITGILAPTSPVKNGKPLRISVNGTGTVYLPSGDGRSTAINQFFNLARTGPTPIKNGGATFVHNGSAWVLLQHDQGDWVVPPFTAAAFAGSGGAWTVDPGDVAFVGFRLAGKTLSVAFTIGTTSVAAVSNVLYMNNSMYGGFTIATATNVANGIGYAVDANANVAAYVSASAATSNAVQFVKVTGAWAVSSNTTYVYGQISFPVN